MPAAYSGHVLPGEQPATTAGEGKSGKAPAADSPPAERPSPTASASEPEGGKLKPNELNPLVLSFLEANKDDCPHGPGQVAKALQGVRSISQTSCVFEQWSSGSVGAEAPELVGQPDELAQPVGEPP
jgi:hypothetical protein